MTVTGNEPEEMRAAAVEALSMPASLGQMQAACTAALSAIKDNPTKAGEVLNGLSADLRAIVSRLLDLSDRLLKGRRELEAMRQRVSATRTIADMESYTLLAWAREAQSDMVGFVAFIRKSIDEAVFDDDQGALDRAQEAATVMELMSSAIAETVKMARERRKPAAQ